MNLSQKCNCCIHENVCSKKSQYNSACNRISNAVDYTEKDLVIVDIKCNHFAPHSVVFKGGVQE